MRNIKKFENWSINEEVAPRLPKSEEYWTKKGKKGKSVALYTHDDMDGIVCAIEMKKYLLNAGFKIVKYGVLNYTEGWKYTTLDPTLINIVLDFANMPGDERDDLVDYYLDHHGLFSDEQLLKYRNSPVQKKKTGSAYEALCQSLGIPQDALTVEVIDMIDSAKYDHYGVSWKRLLDFNLSDMKKSKDVRKEFGAAFNQFLKRSDIKTLIEVIENCNDASIWAIFNAMTKLYPGNNLIPKTGKSKDFIEDSTYRLNRMAKQTRGSVKNKKVYNSQSEFLNDFKSGSKVEPDGYQIIGDLAFVPTGTWANALRARTIIMEDFEAKTIMEKLKAGGDPKEVLTESEYRLWAKNKDYKGILSTIPNEPKFILLQYGGTLQVCSYKPMSEMELPTLKSGKVVEDLGQYMSELLKNFKEHLGYYDPDTSIGQDEITVSGGHTGIGSISNIFGSVKSTGELTEIKFAPNGSRYIDMFKNKVINDLSGIKFNISLKWGEPSEYKSKEPEMDNKVRNIEDVRKIDPSGRIKKYGEI